jgi:hypothetical protein
MKWHQWQPFLRWSFYELYPELSRGAWILKVLEKLCEPGADLLGKFRKVTLTRSNESTQQ